MLLLQWVEEVLMDKLLVYLLQQVVGYTDSHPVPPQESPLKMGSIGRHSCRMGRCPMDRPAISFIRNSLKRLSTKTEESAQCLIKDRTR